MTKFPQEKTQITAKEFIQGVGYKDVGCVTGCNLGYVGKSVTEQKDFRSQFTASVSVVSAESSSEYGVSFQFTSHYAGKFFVVDMFNLEVLFIGTQLESECTADFMSNLINPL